MRGTRTKSCHRLSAPPCSSTPEQRSGARPSSGEAHPGRAAGRALCNRDRLGQSRVAAPAAHRSARLPALPPSRPGRPVAAQKRRSSTSARLHAAPPRPEPLPAPSRASSAPDPRTRRCPAARRLRLLAREAPQPRGSPRPAVAPPNPVARPLSSAVRNAAEPRGRGPLTSWGIRRARGRRRLRPSSRSPPSCICPIQAGRGQPGGAAGGAAEASRRAPRRAGAGPSSAIGATARQAGCAVPLRKARAVLNVPVERLQPPERKGRGALERHGGGQRVEHLRVMTVEVSAARRKIEGT